MPTALYWVDGPWPGRLALASRPRGGDWIDDEMAAWRRGGVDVILSLLTQEEEQDLGLTDEARVAQEGGMKFMSLPITDRQAPESEADAAATLENVDATLSSGRNVVVHCRQGIGRTGLVGACLLILRGSSADAAMRKLSATRGVSIPETPAQRQWIEHYAATLAGA